MIPAKNKIGFQQYIKDKPVKWGIKSFLLCESKSWYIMNVDIYTGKVQDDSSFIADLAVTGSLIARMCKPC